MKNISFQLYALLSCLGPTYAQQQTPPSQIPVDHLVRVNAGVINGKFAPIHGINAAPRSQGESIGNNPSVVLPDSWTGIIPAGPGAGLVYNRTWESDYRMFFDELKIPQSRSAHSPGDINSMWGINAGETSDYYEPFISDFPTSERQYSFPNSPIIPIPGFMKISSQDNYNLDFFGDYLSDLGDCEAIWVLGNRKAYFEANSPMGVRAAPGFNRVPNHRTNFAKVSLNILRYFSGHSTIWDHQAGTSGMPWPQWQGKYVNLVEFWNEPYLNSSYLSVECNNGFSNFQETEFWNGSGKQYADQFIDLRSIWMNFFDGPIADNRFDSKTLMASLNFPRCSEGTNSTSDICDPNSGGAGQLPRVPFTRPFFDQMENRYAGFSATGEKWKTILDAVSVHWYVDTPDEFLRLFRNADVALAHSDYEFLDQNPGEQPEIWVTEWNRHRDASGVNYATTSGAMPFLINGLYYLDGLYNGDFSHAAWDCQDLDDNGLPEVHPSPISWQPQAPLHLPLAGAQVFGERGFWTREGEGPYSSLAGPVRKDAGLAWYVYGVRLLQEAPDRMQVLSGVSAQPFPSSSATQAAPQGTQTNRTVLAGANLSAGNERIVIVSSSLDRENEDDHPDFNDPNKLFTQRVVIENFPFVNGYSIQREVAWNRALPDPNASPGTPQMLPVARDFSVGGADQYGVDLQLQPIVGESYNSVTGQLSFEVTMRKNSYEVYTIVPAGD